MKLIDGTKKYYKANLHAHTTCSDGALTPEQVIGVYAEKGYDILALTDHRIAGGERNESGVLVLPGVEYDFTFPGQVLHVVALLPDAECAKNISYTVGGSNDHLQVIRQICDCGGVAIAAHPAWSLNTPELLASLEGCCATEVYNSMSGVPWNPPRADSTGILDVTASNTGRLFGFVASDDSHWYSGEQGMSYTMVQTDEVTVPSVLEALKAGRFYASQGPVFYDVELTQTQMIVKTSPVNTCVFVSNVPWVTGRCRSGEGMTEFVYDIQPGDRFLRCEIIDAQGRRAWTSPVKVNC